MSSLSSNIPKSKTQQSNEQVLLTDPTSMDIVKDAEDDNTVLGKMEEGLQKVEDTLFPATTTSNEPKQTTASLPAQESKAVTRPLLEPIVIYKAAVEPADLLSNLPGEHRQAFTEVHTKEVGYQKLETPLIESVG